MKLTKRIAAIGAAMVMSANAMGISANAATTYTTWSTRGIKYFCWVKDEITRKANSKKILDVDTNQKRSGFFIELKGIKKEKARSNNSKHSYLCKHTFLAGAEIKGFSLGWSDDINDRWTIDKYGISKFYPDV